MSFGFRVQGLGVSGHGSCIFVRFGASGCRYSSFWHSAARVWDWTEARGLCLSRVPPAPQSIMNAAWSEVSGFSSDSIPIFDIYIDIKSLQGSIAVLCASQSLGTTEHSLLMAHSES